MDYAEVCQTVALVAQQHLPHARAAVRGDRRQAALRVRGGERLGQGGQAGAADPPPGRGGRGRSVARADTVSESPLTSSDGRHVKAPARRAEPPRRREEILGTRSRNSRSAACTARRPRRSPPAPASPSPTCSASTEPRRSSSWPATGAAATGHDGVSRRPRRSPRTRRPTSACTRWARPTRSSSPTPTAAAPDAGLRGRGRPEIRAAARRRSASCPLRADPAGVGRRTSELLRRRNAAQRGADARVRLEHGGRRLIYRRRGPIAARPAMHGPAWRRVLRAAGVRRSCRQRRRLRRPVGRGGRRPRRRRRRDRERTPRRSCVGWSRSWTRRADARAAARGRDRPGDGARCGDPRRGAVVAYEPRRRPRARRPRRAFDLRRSRASRRCPQRDRDADRSGGGVGLPECAGRQAVGCAAGQRPGRRPTSPRAELIAFPLLFLLSLLCSAAPSPRCCPWSWADDDPAHVPRPSASSSDVNRMSIFALNLDHGLGLGLAIDYSLFIVSRFREELAAGRARGGAAPRPCARRAGRVLSARSRWRPRWRR